MNLKTMRSKRKSDSHLILAVKHPRGQMCKWYSSTKKPVYTISWTLTEVRWESPHQLNAVRYTWQTLKVIIFCILSYCVHCGAEGTKIHSPVYWVLCSETMAVHLTFYLVFIKTVVVRICTANTHSRQRIHVGFQSDQMRAWWDAGGKIRGETKPSDNSVTFTIYSDI